MTETVRHYWSVGGNKKFTLARVVSFEIILKDFIISSVQPINNCTKNSQLDPST